ncbi:MAG: UDP-N-acetylmuramate--L-alanine ligase, partial [Rhodospirillaceae bacterium]|nr:UDP-N-acetylmuramate--L-alanine ligase [Rhodospirillaceae bacterium]
EDPIPGADRDSLVDGLRNRGHRNVRALESADDLPGVIADIAGAGDFVICLGAGNITAWAHALPDRLEALNGDAR